MVAHSTIRRQELWSMRVIIEKIRIALCRKRLHHLRLEWVGVCFRRLIDGEFQLLRERIKVHLRIGSLTERAMLLRWSLICLRSSNLMHSNWHTNPQLMHYSMIIEQIQNIVLLFVIQTIEVLMDIHLLRISWGLSMCRSTSKYQGRRDKQYHGSALHNHSWFHLFVQQSLKSR